MESNGKEGNKLVLDEIDFSYNNMSNAYFEGSYITSSVFRNNIFNGTDFNGIQMYDCKFFNVNFDNTTMVKADFKYCLVKESVFKKKII